MDTETKKRHFEVVDRILRETVAMLEWSAHPDRNDGRTTANLAQLFRDTIVEAYASGVQETGELPDAEMAQLFGYIRKELKKKFPAT